MQILVKTLTTWEKKKGKTEPEMDGLYQPGREGYMDNKRSRPWHNWLEQNCATPVLLQWPTCNRVTLLHFQWLVKQSSSFGCSHRLFTTADSPYTSVKHLIFPRSYLLHVLLRHIQIIFISTLVFSVFFFLAAASPTYFSHKSWSRRFTWLYNLSLDWLT